MRRLSNFIDHNKLMAEMHPASESVRGSLHKDQGPGLVPLDRFETNKTKDSQAYIDKVEKHVDGFATSLSSNAAILYLGNYITQQRLVRGLLDRAQEDACVIIHNKCVTNSQGEVMWPARCALTDENAAEKRPASRIRVDRPAR